MNYLKYIEHAAENLQFFLWHKDYTKRFNELADGDRALSPEWTLEQSEAEALAAQAGPTTRSQKISPDTAAVFKGTDFDSSVKVNVSDAEKVNPFYTPPRTPSGEVKRDDASIETGHLSEAHTSTKAGIQEKAETAYKEAGLKWQPCKSMKHPSGHCRVI